MLRAWSPYILLVIFVLLWGYAPFKALLDKATVVIPWPGLDGAIQRLPPVVAKAAPYAAKFTFNILSASGTSALFATDLRRARAARVLPASCSPSSAARHAISRSRS